MSTSSNTHTKSKPKTKAVAGAQKPKTKRNPIVVVFVMAAVLIVLGSFGGRWWYQHHHIYSSYGPNKVGNIVFNKQLQPKGWDYSTDNRAINAHSKSLSRFVPGQPYEDSQGVTIEKSIKAP